MSAIADGAPRVRLAPHPGAGEAGERLAAAAEALCRAGRIRLVGAQAWADIVHTVGDAPPVPAGRTATWVHSFERVLLREGRLALQPAWARRVRAVAHVANAWLTHGQAAGRLLVDARLVPGERLHCLPLLAPREESGAGHGGESGRAVLRDRLGVPVGVRLVVGIEADPSDRGKHWVRALSSAPRSDVAVALATPDARSAGASYVVRSGAASAGAPIALRLPELLAAADVVVAAGPHLCAFSPEAAALVRGLPVIAVTTDSAAELVLATGLGFVVQPDPLGISRAVLAQIDAGLAPRRTLGAPDPWTELVDLARALMGIYRITLGQRAIGGAA